MKQLGLEGNSNHMTDPITDQAVAVEALSVELELDEQSDVMNTDVANIEDSSQSTSQVHRDAEGSNEDDGPGQVVCPPDEEVLQLWSEHYDNYYWYCYHEFCGRVSEGEEGAGDGVEGDMVEEHVVEENGEGTILNGYSVEGEVRNKQEEEKGEMEGEEVEPVMDDGTGGNLEPVTEGGSVDDTEVEREVLKVLEEATLDDAVREVAGILVLEEKGTNLTTVCDEGNEGMECDDNEERGHDRHKEMAIDVSGETEREEELKNKR